MSTQPRLQPTRRTVLRTAAWTAPAVTIAVAAPAFATSLTPFTCKPTGCKGPGSGGKTKDYFLTPGCGTSAVVVGVSIDGKTATLVGDQWVLRNQADSQANLSVTITSKTGQTWTGTVKFLPC